MLENPNVQMALLDGDSRFHLIINVLIVVAIALVSYFIVRRFLIQFAKLLAPKLGRFLGELANDPVLFSRVALFIPAVIIHQGVYLIEEISAPLGALVQRLIAIATIILGLGIANRLMLRGNEVYTRYPIARSRPIKGFLQVVTIILYAIGCIVIIATALDKSPLVFLSGLGAMTAILLVVFRDTLLSIVAGVQLIFNDLIRVGDWIEMPQFGADGDVIDIALHVVRVQNRDKSISVIPTHKFLDGSFKNWRG